MGQKVNPHGMRVGVIKDWDSRWYASNEKVGDLLVEDHKIRVYLKKLLFAAGVSKIEIERSNEIDPSIEVIDVLESVAESVDYLRSKPTPDLVFMDIHLADARSQTRDVRCSRHSE